MQVATRILIFCPEIAGEFGEMSQACFVAAEPTARQWSRLTSHRTHSLFKLRSVKSPTSVTQVKQAASPTPTQSGGVSTLPDLLDVLLSCAILGCSRLSSSSPSTIQLRDPFWLTRLATTSDPSFRQHIHPTFPFTVDPPPSDPPSQPNRRIGERLHVTPIRPEYFLFSGKTASLS